MTVSRALHGPEREGCIARTPDPRNRERHRWSQTEDGWTVFDTVMPMALDRDRNLFGHVSDADRAALERVLAMPDGA